ncbi:MAG TPA: hypothetical protein PJ994_01835 [Tepidiformaceae bacterium]|nr:hypothetical protein [Tepidiformaceae bacterium]HMO94502.1 hypothetical protein [Tepidiformaceae bacterium]
MHRTTGSAALVVRIVIVIGLVFPAAAGLYSRASANSFPGNSDQTTTPDANVTFCLDSSFSTDTSLAFYAMNVMDQTTELYDTYKSSCDIYTDVWWWEADLPGAVRGRRECYWYGSGNTCLLNDLYLDIAELDSNGTYIWEDRAKTAVHELGHAIGLGHDESQINAMKSGDVVQSSPSSLAWRRYSDHDVNHLDTYY